MQASFSADVEPRSGDLLALVGREGLATGALEDLPAPTHLSLAPVFQFGHGGEHDLLLRREVLLPVREVSLVERPSLAVELLRAHFACVDAHHGGRGRVCALLGGV